MEGYEHTLCVHCKYVCITESADAFDTIVKIVINRFIKVEQKFIW